MGSIGNSFGSAGSGTGIDVQGIVSQILAADRAPEVVWQRQQTIIGAQTSALQKINSNLSGLLTSVKALADSLGAFTQKQVSVSDPSVLTATAGTGAASGAHTVVVSSLAATATYYSARKAAATTTLQQGSFALRVGSANPITVTVDGSNNTLEELVSTINKLNAGVTAGLITDSQGVRLNIVSNTTGSAGDLTISSDSVGLGFTKGANGVNASVTFDGVPVTSATNTLDGVIPGLTLQLSSQSASAVTVTVSNDSDTVKQAIADFVNNYNQAAGSINDQFQYNQTTKSAGVLAGDSTLQLVQQKLFAEISANTATNGSIDSLSSIGITLDNNGHLNIDGTKLDAALAGKFSETTAFFQNATDGLATRLNTALTDLTNDKNGPIGLEITGLTNTSTEFDHLIEDFEAQLSTRQERLIREYSQIDATLRQLPLLLAQITGQIQGITG